LSSGTTVSFRRRMKTPSSFTSTSATKREIPLKPKPKDKTKENRKIRKQNNQKMKFTSHCPLVLIPLNKQGINISLPHIGRHIFLQNIAANSVNKTTHISSSESADKLISAKRNMVYIPSRIYKQINKKPEHEL
jgi:hypothetical protein